MDEYLQRLKYTECHKACLEIRSYGKQQWDLERQKGDKVEIPSSRIRDWGFYISGNKIVGKKKVLQEQDN